MEFFLYRSLFLLILSIQILLSEVKKTATIPSQQYTEIYLEVTSPVDISYSFPIRPAKNFGVSMKSTQKDLKLVPTMPINACKKIENDIRGHVAFVNRGDCTFIEKAMQVEQAGATAVIITDAYSHHDDSMVVMVKDQLDNNSFIPAYFLMGRDGAMILNSISRNKITGALISLPYNMSKLANKYRVNRPPWSVW